MTAICNYLVFDYEPDIRDNIEIQRNITNAFIIDRLQHIPVRAATKLDPKRKKTSAPPTH